MFYFLAKRSDVDDFCCFDVKNRRTDDNILPYKCSNLPGKSGIGSSLFIYVSSSSLNTQKSQSYEFDVIKYSISSKFLGAFLFNEKCHSTDIPLIKHKLPLVNIVGKT